MRAKRLSFFGAIAVAAAGCTGVVANSVCSKLEGANFNTKAAPCSTGEVVIAENIPSQSACTTDLNSCNTGDEALLTTYSGCIGALSTCSPGGGEDTFVAALETCNAGISGLTATCATAFGLTTSTSGSSGSTGSSSGSSSSGSSSSSSGASGGVSGMLCGTLLGSGFNAKVAPCATGPVQVVETLPSESVCVTDLAECSTGDETLLTTYAGCLGALGTCSQGEGEDTFVAALEECNGAISGLSASCASAFGLHLSATSGSSGSTTGATGSSSGSTGSSSSGSSGGSSTGH